MGLKLLAYDGSEVSKKALIHALRIMDDDDDELVILYVIPSCKLEEFMELPPTITKAEALDKVNDAVAEVKSKNKKVIGMVREGDVAEEILKLAEEMDVDMIIVGKRGDSKIGRFVVGSVSEIVSKKSTRPVLVVK